MRRGLTRFSECIFFSRFNCLTLSRQYAAAQVGIDGEADRNHHGLRSRPDFDRRMELAGLEPAIFWWANQLLRARLSRSIAVVQHLLTNTRTRFRLYSTEPFRSA